MYSKGNNVNMQTLNIVKLIEENPVTKLSKTYNNILLNKIKENFTDQQQQIFVSSFYCYLNYNQTSDFVIKLDDIWEWIGFLNKANSKKALEKYFVVDKDYIQSNLLIHLDEKKRHGGHNKETILMTIKTFKLFCIKSNTTKANEIHEYFIKLENLLLQTIHEETNELREQLEQKDTIIEQTKEQYKHRLVRDTEAQKQELLLRDFSSARNIVYIVRVKTFENGSYIIKIGESRKGVSDRFGEHKTAYRIHTNTPESDLTINDIEECFSEQKNDVVLLDCFPVLKSREFEKYLHNHPKIKPSQYRKLEGHEKEVELFIIGKELSYATVLQLINNNIKRFNEYNEVDFRLLEEIIEKKNIQIELLEFKLSQKDGNNLHVTENTNYGRFLKETLDTFASQLQQQLQQFTESPPQINPIATIPTNLITGFGSVNKTIGPRLQKINPETLTLVKVYEYVEEALKESNNVLKRPTIEKAIIEGTIYHGFRWNYVSRDNDPNIIHELSLTRQTKTQSLGYIAKLNFEKTEILNVYLDRKSASIENDYSSSSSLDFPVKKGTSTNNHFYMLFDNCEQLLQIAFLDKYCCGDRTKLLLYKDGLGQYDLNENLTREFSCKYDCITILKMSDKTLAKSMDQNKAFNNFYYRKLGRKRKFIQTETVQY